MGSLVERSAMGSMEVEGLVSEAPVILSGEKYEHTKHTRHVSWKGYKSRDVSSRYSCCSRQAIRSRGHIDGSWGGCL